MLEKRLVAVAPQPFLVNGTIDGKITISDPSLFKVKQVISVTATSLPPKELEVKRIENGIIHVGPLKGNIDSREDISQYIVALSAAIFANEQKRPSIPSEEFNRAVYEEEPVVANRSILVDSFGNKISNNNPLPVGISIPDLELRFDQVSSSVMYLGEATIGSLESQAKWKIRKIEIAGTLVSIKWASNDFDQIWNNRTSLIYV